MFTLKRKSSESEKSSSRLLIILLIVVALGGVVYAVLARKHITHITANVALDQNLFPVAETLLRVGGHSEIENRLLAAAVLANDGRYVERYLKKGGDPNYIGDGGMPLVYVAAHKGFEGSVTLLSVFGADMDYHPVKRRNPLLLMANKKKSKQAFELLLANGSDPNVISDYGYPIAYICLRQKQFDWFNLLVTHGADLSYVSPSGRTLLDYAIRYKHTGTIALLTERGARIYRAEGTGTGLTKAVRSNDAGAVLKRLQAGDNPYIKDRYDANALQAAVWTDSVDAVRVLLEAGVDPNIPFGAPLRAAAKKGNLTLVNLLLEHGALPDARRKRLYKTALHQAVCGSMPIVQALVEKGADVNATESLKERTPLWRVTNCKNTEVIAYLESKGARYSVDDAWYRMATPFEKAAADGDIQTMKQLISEGQDVNARDAFGDTALHSAAAGGKVKAMKWLVQQGALPMFRGGLIRTPLFWAAFHGHLDACQYLMKQGCRVKDKDLYGDIPLHQAARGNQPDVVELFLKKGADANANSKKTSPVMAAARSNAGNAIEALIAGGADVNTHGSSQRTALHDAVLYNSPDAARVLLAHDADLRAEDFQGYTPLEAAEGKRDTIGGGRVYRQIMAKEGTPIHTSYDCDRAVDAVERLVCADRKLAALDVDLDRYYQVLLASFDRKTAEGLRKEQRHWLEDERGACVFSRLHYPEDDAFYSAMKCLKPRYQARVQVLKRSVSRHGFSMKAARDTAPKEPGVNTWGVSMKVRKDAPKGRFKAFYYNTNDPTKVVASEEVDQVSVNYVWDKFHAIKSENFGAYWVGAFEFKQRRQMMFQIALSRSRVKIVVNGKAIHSSL